MAADVGSGTLRNHSLVSLQRMRRKNFSLALRIMSPRTREQAISVMQRGLAAEEATPSEAATGERGGGGGGEGNSGLSDPRMLSESVDVTSTEDDNRPAFQPSSLPSSSLLDAQVDELHRRLEGLQEWSESALEVMEAGAEEEKVKEEEEAAREESESFLPKLKSKKERTKSKAGASRLGKQTLHAARVRGTEERPRSSLEVARREKKLAGHVRSKSSLSQHAAPRPLDEAVRVSGKSNLKLKPLRDIPTLKPFAPSSGDPYRIKFIEVYNPLTSSGILCAAGRMPIKKRKQLPRRTEEERDEAAKPEQVGEEVAAKLEEEKGKENEERVNEQVEEGAKIEAGEASEGILEVSEEE
uniref:Uncharacterized protein n=1 Tax=Hanusia phi TaxID=3032 RepID=A0A7S0EYF5_9CRYP